MFAEPPQGVAAASFAFKSGALIAKAVRLQTPARQKPEERQTSTTRSAWGAAKPRAQNIDEESEEPPPPTATKTGATAKEATGGAATTKEETKAETKKEPKSESPSKLQRGEDGKAVGKHVVVFIAYLRAGAPRPSTLSSRRGGFRDTSGCWRREMD
eukprot:1122575-Pyramimonas_sp.AAC.1